MGHRLPFLLLAIHSAVAVAAPSLSNVRFAQRKNSNLVDISYDLAATTSVSVTVEVSTDGGTTWGIQPKAMTGDVGENQSAGTDKRMLWDAGQDCGTLRSANCIVRILADDGITLKPETMKTSGGSGGSNHGGVSGSGSGGSAPGLVPLGKDQQGYEEYVWPRDSSVVIRIPAGDFTMGSNDEDADEKPVHQVYLSEYYIDKYEVTNRQFAQFVERTGYRTDAERGQSGVTYVWNSASSEWRQGPGVSWRDYSGPGLADHPVVIVSWNDAMAYCNWAGKRLPTEAEWERAARGVDERKYPWGADPPDGSQCNFADRNIDVEGADANSNDGWKFTAPVGNYPAGVSPCGCMDMAGNAWEWCNDLYASRYYEQTGSATNPQGPPTGDYRIIRGGGWGDEALDLRCSGRSWSSAAERNGSLGFRCVRSVSQ